jgi:hypothetical protein
MRVAVVVPVWVLAVAWEAVPVLAATPVWAAAPVSAAVLVLAVVPEVLARPLALPRSFDGEGMRTLTKATQRAGVERNGSARYAQLSIFWGDTGAGHLG